MGGTLETAFAWERQHRQEHRVIAKVVLIAEIEIEQPTAQHTGAGQAARRLDAFREAVQPSQEYGITLYQATADDLSWLNLKSSGPFVLLEDQPRKETHAENKTHPQEDPR